MVSVCADEGGSTEKLQLQLTIKSWRPVARWKWKECAADDSCGICRMSFEACCPACRKPGAACPVASGQCSHIFHVHCINKWVNGPQGQSQPCPMCRQTWHFVDDDATTNAATLKADRNAALYDENWQHVPASGASGASGAPAATGTAIGSTSAHGTGAGASTTLALGLSGSMDAVSAHGIHGSVDNATTSDTSDPPVALLGTPAGLSNQGSFNSVASVVAFAATSASTPSSSGAATPRSSIE